MKQPIIIAYYDDSRGRGGTTRYMMELIGGLDRDLYRPVFMAPRPCAWHADLRDRDVEIVTLTGPDVHEEPPENSAGKPESLVTPVNRRRATRRLPLGLAWTVGLSRDVVQLVRLFRRKPVDLLHSNNTGAEPAPIAARLAGIPRVLGTWHVDSTYDLDGKREGSRYRLLENASMRALHHAIAVSEATGRDWISRCHLDARYQRHISVVHNGIDPLRVQRRRSRTEARADLGLPENALLIGSLGRLDEAKGYEFLLRALPELICREPDLHVALAGRGPLEAELRGLANRLGIASSVHFLGFVDDVRKVLEALDVYVQPSLCEAHPISVLEAGGMGLPIVASYVGGIPETVVDGVTGYIVPPGDPKALMCALDRLCRDRVQQTEMGKRGRDRVLEHFTREKMVTKTVAVYERMLNS